MGTNTVPGALALEKPGEQHKAAALAYLKAHRDAGETGFLHGGAMLEQFENYGDWLQRLEALSRPETTPEGWSPASTFFALRQGDGHLVGMVDIRHVLVPSLRAFGGHIGYGVCPEERGKGYATRMLALALDHCRRTLGLGEVMLSCAADNEASRRTILRAGGRLEGAFTHSDGSHFEKYWIAL